MRNHVLQVGIVFLLIAPCLSQTVCRISLVRPNETFDTVSVNGTVCLLIASAKKVTVTTGGELIVLGRVTITEVEANGAKNIGIVGGASATNIFSYGTSGDVVVGYRSRVERLVMKDTGFLRHEGFIGHLTSKNSGDLNITRGVIGSPSSNALFIEEGQPDIMLCAASIGKVQTRNSSPKFIAENSSKCRPTNISSVYSVGTGSSIVVKGVSLMGKHSFSTYNVGEVEISSTTFLGRIGMRSVAGRISLSSALVEGSVSLIGRQVSTTISDSEFKGVVTIGAAEPKSPRPSKPTLSTSISKCHFADNLKFGPSSGEVKVSGSEFSNSRVYAETRSGGVALTGNTGLSLLRVQVNSVGVNITDNEISDGVFRSNVEVSLVGNKFETLSCVGNRPAPVLVDNVIQEGTGQCASS